MRQKLWTAALAALLLVVPSAPRAAEKAVPAVDPVAQAQLTRMCDYLKGLSSFSFRAEVNVDEVYAGGITLQTSRTENIAVRRPGMARLDTLQDGDARTVFYDGGTFTVFHKNKNLYSAVSVPPTLDAALDAALEKYGVVWPLTELLRQDPCRAMTANVTAGFFVGRRTVQGVPCQHLAFSQKDVDWQIWIAEGDRPLPRKLVIVDKTLPGAPNYEALFEDWKVDPRLKEAFFTFTPPKNAARIDVIPRTAAPQPAK